MIFLKLLLSFIQVGMFSVGGGYAALPLIQNQVVENNGWLSMSEFTDLITIAEMTPGPIAVNSASFVGIRIAGPLGAVIATLGCILPSIFIVSILAHIYFKYKKISALQNVLECLRPAVVALIAGAGISILKIALFDTGAIAVSNLSIIGAILFVVAFAVLRKWKPNPILVMALCGVAGLSAELIINGFPA